MSVNEMSLKKSVICKINSEFQGSSIKKMRLDDDSIIDSDVLRSLKRTISSSSSLAYSASYSGGFSVALSEEDDHRSLGISSGCSISKPKEIATDTRLEANQISETDISTLITNNFRSEILGETAEMDSATTERSDQRVPEKKMKRTPTQAELDDFFSAAERYEQKRFTEKYNYDVVNDTPLEGRYQWVSLKP